MIASTPSYGSACANHLHTAFVALMPRIELQARLDFRDVKCADKRADMFAAAPALAWDGS